MERIDVRKLGHGKTGFRWTEPPDSLGLGPGDGFASPLEIDLTARRIGADTGVLVEGAVSGSVSAVCSRCLENTERAVKANVSIEYREGLPPEREKDAAGEGESDVGWYTDAFIDPAEDLRQLLLLEVPAFPLCREDCRGLCPTCGANLNEGACACGPKAGVKAAQVIGEAPKKRRK